MVKRFYVGKEKDNKFWRIFYGNPNKPAMSTYASYKVFDSKADALRMIKKGRK